MAEKLKSWLRNDQYFYSFLVIAVGLVSFFLGQSSTVLRADTTAVTYHRGAASVASVEEDKSEPASVVPPIATEESIVVASQSGTKYHLPDCPGAGQIKPENKISFPSAAAAAAAGYSPAANCPGLK